MAVKDHQRLDAAQDLSPDFWAEARKQRPDTGTPIDTRRMVMPNPDPRGEPGSISGEKVIGVGYGGSEYLLPSIIGGELFPVTEAIRLHEWGENPAVGVSPTPDEGVALAKRREREIGRMRMIAGMEELGQTVQRKRRDDRLNRLRNSRARRYFEQMSAKARQKQP